VWSCSADASIEASHSCVTLFSDPGDGEYGTAITVPLRAGLPLPESFGTLDTACLQVG
jgi:hypothetical protein